MNATSPSVDAPRRILVTGGNGYLGSWIVKRLLEAGHRVHATVRRLADASRHRHLLEADPTGGALQLFEADLLAEGSFEAAMAGCDAVIHCASPFRLEGVKDARAELIEPAVRGTRNVLAAANRTPSVRRVVLTSSVAAVYGDSADRPVDGKAFSEEDWNTTSSESHQAYSYSKTLAEREAWKLAQAQNRWNLVVLNPGFILGPALDPSSGGTSQTIMRRFADGTYKSGMIDQWYGIVDVRDVAEAHVRAAVLPKPQGRYILVHRSASLLEFAPILRARFGSGLPLPRRKMPKPILWLFPSLLGFTRRYVARNIGLPIAFDPRRSREELGAVYRPIETTLVEHFQQFIATHKGGVPARGAGKERTTDRAAG